MSTAVIRSPSTNQESTALDFFFLSYGIGRDEDATCSLLEILPKMFTSCRPSSPLHLATAALAVKVSTLWRVCGVSQPIAQRHFIKAVAAIREVIADPVRNKSDEALMTTLVLEIYDSTTAYYQGNPTGMHLSGSVALMKHRGALNYRNNTSQRMMLAIRSKLVQDALGKPQAIPLPHRSIWDYASVLSPSPAAAIDRLALRLAQLLDQSQLEHTDGTQLLSLVVDLQDDLNIWAKALPGHWQPKRIDPSNIDVSITSTGIYNDRCDAYVNFSVATLWNWHRTVELRVLLLLRHCRGDRVFYFGTLQHLHPTLRCECKSLWTTFVLAFPSMLAT